MKGKFKLLGHIGLGMFLVCALMLAVVPAAKVEAATAVTSVWVEFPAEDAAGEAVTTYNVAGDAGTEALFRIHFKATTALVRDVDKITVQFPDGSDTTMGPSGSSYAFSLGAGCSTASNFDIMVDPYAAGKTYSDYQDCTAAAYGGYRITLTIDVDIPAGSEVWLLIDDADTMVCGGAQSTDAYKVKVHTSKDTTPVLSKGFYLGTSDEKITTTASSISPTSAGATNVEYTFTFTLTEALVTADTITITFPYGTTLPSSMAASGITVYDASTAAWYTCGVTPTIDADLRTVKLTTPHAIAITAGAKVKFATTCGISNPTRAYASWGAVTTKSRVGFIHTSKDLQDTPLYAYEITHDAATKVDFDYTASPDLVTGCSDKYTMINMYSSPLYLQVEDQYGNVVSTGAYATVYITLASTSGTGVFYYDSDESSTGDGSYTQISGTQQLSGGKKNIYYKDTAAATYTLTASYSGLTSCTWTFQVCSAVSLYDRYDNLINTYAPTSSTPVEETNATTTSGCYKGGHYVQAAINAATSYDKIVLGDGHYETDGTSDNKLQFSGDYVTLKSLNGADYTTIDARDIATGNNIILVNPGCDYITIENLTIQGNKSVAWGVGILCKNSDGFTFQNLKFIDVPSDSIAVSPEGASDTILSGTITNNTITGIGRLHGGAYEVGGIRVQSYNSNTVTAVKITNNTISACYGDLSTAIVVNEHSGAVTDITVQGNTISGCYRGILLEDGVTGLTGTRAIANNSITGCVEGVKVKDSADVQFDLVKNTITNNKLYGIYFYNATPTASNITIKYNDISGNGTWGIYNTFTASAYDVVAKYNWWGDATGPGAGTGTYASLTARGSGDNVSCEATYSPWLHKSLANVVADNASYQACTIKLVSGWNTLSTPVKLIDTADAINELIPSGMTIGYYYDATGWHQITSGYVLNACDAVYVKMSATTYVLFKFDASAFSTPSKSLNAGWNLIGLAYLGYTSASDAMDADDAVASVAKTAAGLPGYAQVVSPSLNGNQTDILGLTGTTWAVSYGQTGVSNKMYAGLGYWIYMQNTATLAGFELTPIAPAFGLD